MTNFTENSKGGFYTVEAALFLPLIILAVLTLGYFMKADAAWENCMHAALDECTYTQSSVSDASKLLIRGRISERVSTDESGADLKLSHCRFSYSDALHTDLNSFNVSMSVHLPLPMGFGHDFDYEEIIKYRDFCGLKYDRPSLGYEGLESDISSEAVWIFPQSGRRYHRENCTYVRASVRAYVLDNSIRKKYSACEICDSANVKTGSVVFCFSGENTCYHRGSCRSINRHTVVIDKHEAEEKGYSPCSKCGG